MVILRRTERAMVRSMCVRVKLVDRKKMEDLMEMLGLKETLDIMAKTNGVRWYGHVIRRDDDNILNKPMMMGVNGKRTRGQPKLTWRRQVEESVKKIGLNSRKLEIERDGGKVWERLGTFGNKKTRLKLEMMMIECDHLYPRPTTHFEYIVLYCPYLSLFGL